MKTITHPYRTIQGRSLPTLPLSPTDVVTFLAADSNYLQALLTETGLQPSDLRALPNDPALLDGIIAWVLSSDDRILTMSTFLSRTPDQTAFGLTQLQRRSPDE